jgi:hypothetical protein
MLLRRYFTETRTYRGAAAMYVAGPGVFSRRYSQELQDYIDHYSEGVDRLARHFTFAENS